MVSCTAVVVVCKGRAPRLASAVTGAGRLFGLLPSASWSLGPLSDRFGGRRPVLGGAALHVVISLLRALAPGIGTLIALRFVQGSSTLRRQWWRSP